MEQFVRDARIAMIFDFAARVINLPASRVKNKRGEVVATAHR
jgi:hypothetical protein